MEARETESLTSRRVKRIVYISGPMRGYPDFNRPAFLAAEEKALPLGWQVLNPARMDENDPDMSDWSDEERTRHYVERDLKALIGMRAELGDAIAMLPGWQNSKGAMAEYMTARWLGLRVLSAETFLDLEQPAGPFVVSEQTMNTVQNAKAEVPMFFGKHTSPKDRMRAVAEDLGQRLAGYRIGTGEVRITDPATGGQKGSKLARFDLIPSDFMTEFAEVFGRGAQKYEARNWERGYAWGLNIAALQRHLHAWIKGEERDELGNHHLAQVAWHAAVLMTFQKHGLGTDDRSQIGRAA